MDEYDELFEIEDNFDNQFADELEALADLERGEGQQTVAMQSVLIVCLFKMYGVTNIIVLAKLPPGCLHCWNSFNS